MSSSKKIKLGELLADMVLYGDICEHSHPADWGPSENGDVEAETRMDIAATLIGLANNAQAGRVSNYDDLLKDLLSQEVESPL